MPDCKEILSDGPEHMRRTLRRASLRARMQTETGRRERLLRRLGSRAWELRVPTCGEAASGVELEKLQRRIKRQEGKFRRERKKLESEKAEAARLVRDEEELRGKLRAELDTPRRGLDRHARAVAEAERDLAKAERARDALGDDLELNKRRQKETALEGAVPEEQKASAAELEAAAASLRTRLKESRRRIAASERRLDEHRRALSPLQEASASARAELDVAGARVRDLRERLRGLDRRLRATGAEKERALEPLRLRRDELHAGLGEELLANRSDEPELAGLFAALDLSASTVESLEAGIRSETNLLNLLDPDAAVAFYALLCGAGMLASALLAAAIATLLVVL